jgi:hypothetical protein
MSQISHNNKSSSNKLTPGEADGAAPAPSPKAAGNKKLKSKNDTTLGINMEKKEKQRLKSPVHATRPTSNLYGNLYKTTGWLVDYAYVMLEKFAKKERFGLSIDIKQRTNAVMHKVINVVSYNPFNNREKLLRELSVDVKTLIVLVRVAYNQRCVSQKNRDAWIRKLVDVDNLAVGIAMWLEQEEKRAAAKREKEAHEKSKN